MNTGATYNTADYHPDSISKDGTTYLLVPDLTEGAETGTASETITYVTYVYAKAPTVTVRYVDPQGIELQASQTVAFSSANASLNEGQVSFAYTTNTSTLKPTSVSYDNIVYNIVSDQTKGLETGSLQAGESQTVTYVYKKETISFIIGPGPATGFSD